MALEDLKRGMKVLFDTMELLVVEYPEADVSIKWNEKHGIASLKIYFPKHNAVLSQDFGADGLKYTVPEVSGMLTEDFMNKTRERLKKLKDG